MADKVKEIETLQDGAGRFQCPGCGFSTQLRLKMATHLATKHPGLLGKKNVIKPAKRPGEPAETPEKKAAEAVEISDGGKE